MQVGYDVTTCTAVLPYAREGIRKEGITTRQRRSRRSSAGFYGKRLGECAGDIGLHTQTSKTPPTWPSAVPVKQQVRYQLPPCLLVPELWDEHDGLYTRRCHHRLDLYDLLRLRRGKDGNRRRRKSRWGYTGTGGNGGGGGGRRGE